jgi:benzylsuccinate CoA-transferase BbsF subunit
MLGLPLRGVRVVDFTWQGAGPFTTKALADHGAEVIRVESSKRLDGLRSMGPYPGGVKGPERSGYFANRNSNKRDLVLNLKHPAARDLALRLIAQSDVVANNFGPGTMESLRLAYDDVRAVRPDVIYLAMSVNGSSGPERDEVGYGLTVSARTALHYLCGLPDRLPVGTGTNYPDHVAAPCHATFAVLAALRHRRRTGQGQLIDLSQAETMISLLGPAVLDCSANGRVPLRQGNRDAAAAPSGVYPCAGDDRWLALSVFTDDQWRALAAELDAPEWTTDPRFATLVARHQHHDTLDAAIAERTRPREPYALMAALLARGVPAGVMQTAEDLVERDPQLRARGHFARLDHSEMGPSLYDAPPFRLQGVGEPIMRTPAPLVGQHTREVCQEHLGLADDEIDRLIADGVLV